MSEKYNGWTNYETWAVNLWLGNDEGSYNYWREIAQELWDGSEEKDHWTRKDNAVFALADRLKDEITDPEACALLGESSLYSDLLTAAFSDVNWREIAEGMLEGIAVEEEAEEEEAV